jgi:hypothetical protein
MVATETLTNETASGPRWVRWLLVGVLAGAGVAVRSATADSATPAPAAVRVVAPTLTLRPVHSLLETAPLQGRRTPPPTHCFPTAALAEHMMLDWRVQVTCVRAYLLTLRGGAAQRVTSRSVGDPQLRARK